MAMCMAMLLGMLISSGVSAEVAGRLLFTRGDVQIFRAGSAPLKAGRGDSVDVGDSIQTGNKSNAQLRMSDGAMIALRANTLFKIDQQTYHKDAPGEGSQAAELLRGGMRAITGAIGHTNPSAVSYKTPVATIGIRGTVIDVIYVPPEGLPGLPGVRPGHYTLVLKGQVEVSNPAGSLTLGIGEIAYTPDDNTPPVLRPDLTWVFVQYASLTKPPGFEAGSGEGGGEAGGSGDGTTAGSTEPDVGSIANVLTQTAIPQPSVATGPFALIAATDFSSGYLSTFVSQTVTTGSSGELTLANGGAGDYTSFNSNGATPTISTTSTAAGDSTIYWGGYSAADVTVGPVDLTTGNVDFIDATNVLVSLNDLPTTGSYTYTMQGSTSGLVSGSLTVDFGTAKMDVAIDDTGNNNGAWFANGQDISSLYGTGVSLSDGSTGTGTLIGRFVGTNAEGAMTAYRLNGIVLDTGTAAFTR